MISSPTTSESWNLDALGNQKSVTLNGSTVTRAISSQNQIKSLSSSTTNLNYDADGNTINDQNGQQYKYDAWNRVVKVTTPGGDTIKYQYDALGRRITESDSAAGTTSDLYYSNQNQVIYEQIVNSNTGSITNDSYYWSPFYVNQLIARDSQTFYQATGVTDNAVGIINASSLRMYAQQDADYNVTSLTNSSGAVVERYVYDPYGEQIVMNATGGVLNASANGWIYGLQGGRFSPVTGLIRFGVRDENMSTGSWIEQDPTGPMYVNGADLYQVELGNPEKSVDSSGRQVVEPVNVNEAIGAAEGEAQAARAAPAQAAAEAEAAAAAATAAESQSVAERLGAMLDAWRSDTSIDYYGQPDYSLSIERILEEHPELVSRSAEN